MAQLRTDIKRDADGTLSADPKGEGNVDVIKITGEHDKKVVMSLNLGITQLSVRLPGRGGTQVFQGVIVEPGMLLEGATLNDFVEFINRKTKKLIFPSGMGVLKSDS